MKYPNIKVKLSGTDGNAFAIMGKCKEAMRQAKVDHQEIKKFVDECMQGDYNHLLRTCMEWVYVL